MTLSGDWHSSKAQAPKHWMKSQHTSVHVKLYQVLFCCARSPVMGPKNGPHTSVHHAMTAARYDAVMYTLTGSEDSYSAWR